MIMPDVVLNAPDGSTVREAERSVGLTRDQTKGTRRGLYGNATQIAEPDRWNAWRPAGRVRAYELALLRR
jgi:hypothetical protein